MALTAANKNRWGDPPLLVESRLSPLAVVAIALAVVCVLVAGLATEAVAAGQAAAWSLSAAFLLLLFVQFPLVQLPVLMAYVLLCTCRPAGPIRGRGLAWAAIGLSYVALIWHLALTASVEPHLRLAALGVLAAGVLHLPIFAAESHFAKHAVATLVIAGTFLALLFPWLHYTREESRRLRCQNNLRQLGSGLQQAVTFDRGSEQRSIANLLNTDEPASAPEWPSWISQVQPKLDSDIVPPIRLGIPTDSDGAGTASNVYQQQQLPAQRSNDGVAPVPH